MCNYQTLFYDDYKGYVVRCSKCCKLQIMFGNFLLTLNEEDFTSFRRILIKARNEQPENISMSMRSIVISTPCEGIKLVMSPRELLDLNDMLESVDTELQSLALLKLFNT